MAKSTDEMRMFREACANDFQSNLAQAAASRKNSNAISAAMKTAIPFRFNRFLRDKPRLPRFRNEIFALL